jgi:hypothetical protein
MFGHWSEPGGWTCDLNPEWHRLVEEINGE